MGGKFQAAFLPEKASMQRQEIVIDLPVASTSKFWSSPTEAATFVKRDMTVFGMPWSKTEPAIDAMSSPCLYWQVGC